MAVIGDVKSPAALRGLRPLRASLALMAVIGDVKSPAALRGLRPLRASLALMAVIGDVTATAALRGLRPLRASLALMAVIGDVTALAALRGLRPLRASLALMAVIGDVTALAALRGLRPLRASLALMAVIGDVKSPAALRGLRPLRASLALMAVIGDVKSPAALRGLRPLRASLALMAVIGEVTAHAALRGLRPLRASLALMAVIGDVTATAALRGLRPLRASLALMAAVVFVVLSGCHGCERTTETKRVENCARGEVRSATSAVARAGARVQKQCPEGIQLVAPGLGAGIVTLGKTAPNDVLRCLGTDAELRRAQLDITGINYDYDEQKHYLPDRAPNVARPQRVDFDRGVASRITFGPGQICFETSGGIGVHSTRDAVERVFGAQYDLQRGTLARLHYPDLGIVFSIDHDGQVIAFDLFPPGSERIACPRDFPGADRFQAVPGKGYRGAILGQSSPEQVIAALSNDGRIERHDSQIQAINYDYQASGRYKPDRPASHELPSSAKFVDGRLVELEFGVYQRCVVVAGLRTSSSTADMERVLGTGYLRSRTTPLKPEDLQRLGQLGLSKDEITKISGPSNLETYDYEALGVAIDVNRESRLIKQFTLHLPAPHH